MSNNTNTLFWVITGAVIILAVFLLINVSQKKQMRKIFGVMESKWTGEEYDDIDYDQYMLEPITNEDYTMLNNCGTNVAFVDGYRMQMVDYYLYNNGQYIRFFITNKSGELVDERFTVNFYNCETRTLVGSCATRINNLEIDKTQEITCMGGNVYNETFNYYFEAKFGY